MERWPYGLLLGVAGGAITLAYLGEGVATMEMQHWIMLLVIFVAGYVAHSLWPGPGRSLGLS